MDEKSHLMEPVGDGKTTAQITSTIEPISRPPTKAFNRQRHHGRLFWAEISWRIAGSVIFSIVLIAILYTFSQKGNLSRWEKRWFNTLAILFSSLISLSLGSLLGLLGSMLRWPLLMREAHKPMDVDLILGMANPTGALRLIWHHTVKDWKWTATTAVVTVYLLTNIIARLSVAAFGLTFDLNEQPGIEYPVMITNWGTDAWFNQSADSFNERIDGNIRRMNDHATFGLTAVDTEFDSKNPSDYTLTNSSGQGLDRKVEGDKVTYSYALKEYRGLEASSSKEKVLHSSSSCIGRHIWGYDVYEKGKIVGNINQTSDPPYKEDFLNVIEGMSYFYNEGIPDSLWIAPFDSSNETDPSACATTYLYMGNYPSGSEINATFFECNTCLTDARNKPGIGTDILSGLPSGNSTLTANLLVLLGTFERRFQYFQSKQLWIRSYSIMNKNAHFLNTLNDALHDGTTEGAPRDNVAQEAELYAAHVAARLPLLAIIGADLELPRMTRELGASERPFINVVLEVRWKRTVAVLVAILAGQLIVTGIVKFLCRNVFVRDHDSYLSLARLLKTAMQQVEGRSTDSGKELAAYLDGEGVNMRYGTRRREDGILEADLWNVDGGFPDAMYG